MDRITNWEARRSGAAITVTGRDEAGRARRWPNIAAIERIAGRIVATGKDGEEFMLA